MTTTQKITARAFHLPMTISRNVGLVPTKRAIFNAMNEIEMAAERCGFNGERITWALATDTICGGQMVSGTITALNPPANTP